MRLSEWTGRPQVHIVGLFVSLVAVIAVAAFAIGTLEYTKTRGKLMLTAFLVGGYFLTMLAATRIHGEGNTLRLRLAAQAMATAALLLLMLGLWSTPDSDEYWKATAATTLLTIGMVFTGVVIRSGLTGPAERGLVWMLTGCSAALTVLAVAAVIFEIGNAAYWWVFGLLGVGWLVEATALAVLRIWRHRAGAGQADSVPCQ